ncbi:response regulator transcription factor [Sulfuricurvum sp.]|uniref:response regulator transcription factor n=1 Tax=Sulfuricurvum sp. TaxID=2025608 RepID=UPI00286D7464|nr:LuxR C-terminal-related transcriptional regulator [Sulfuricurvum sp.]
MRLYLLSDDSALRDRWMSSLMILKPTVSSMISSDIEREAILFVHDTMIVPMSETEIKDLFGRRVMVFSMTPDFSEAQHFLQRGAMGYGNAMMHESHLHSAYQALEEGKVWLHPDFITLMISQIQDRNSSKEKSLAVLEVLSPREREVALMLGDGATHQEIADTLEITVRTIKAHASAIYQKLSVKDRLALSLLLHS